MELICHELQIPKRFINEIDENRFAVRAHKSWIKQLGQHGKVGSFCDNASNATNNWQQIFITVSVFFFRYFRSICEYVCTRILIIMFIYLQKKGLSKTFTQSDTVNAS